MVRTFFDDLIGNNSMEKLVVLRSIFYQIAIYIIRLDRKSPRQWVRIPPKAKVLLTGFLVWDRRPCGPLGIFNIILMQPKIYDFAETHIPYQNIIEM